MTLNQAGPDITKDSDITIFQPPVNIPREIRTSFKGLKIGVDRNWTNFKVDSKISGLFQEKLKYLENKGISTKKILSEFKIQDVKLFQLPFPKSITTMLVIL